MRDIFDNDSWLEHQREKHPKMSDAELLKKASKVVANDYACIFALIASNYACIFALIASIIALAMMKVLCVTAVVSQASALDVVIDQRNGAYQGICEETHLGNYIRAADTQNCRIIRCSAGSIKLQQTAKVLKYG
jgi:hypothetical protein